MTIPDVSPSELAHWRDLADSLADEADRISMAGFRRDIRVEAKPDHSFVTEADQAIERLLRGRLRAALPGCGLIGEEEGADSPGASLTWYIDPIDATHNYMRGVPVFATLLAAAVDGEIVLGLVSAPALHERWVAWRGGGAWAGAVDGAAGRRLHVSGLPRIEEATLVYGSRTADMATGAVPGLDATLARAWRERGFGDFWGYMLVAEGAVEAMIETGAHPWDWAAPMIMVEEAGGRFTTAAGERRIDGESVVASNGRFHGELLAALGTRR